jgi:hypothetical protein
MQSGAALNLNLAVCLSAACLPISSAKVPLAIAKWLAVLRRPVISQAHGQGQPTSNTQLEQVGSMLHTMKPSQPWCVALALSHSEQCRMWQIKFK